MTIELARRLFHGEVLATADLEAALLDTVTRGVPFLEALVQRQPGGDLVDRELERVTGGGISPVFADFDLVGLLPEGICERLLAVPVGRDPTTDEITVAAVDPLDPHIVEEFGYHLEAPVIVLAATRLAVVTALGDSSLPGDSPPRTRAYAEEPRTRPGVAPPAVAAAPFLAIPGDASRGTDSEPPIPLVRRSVVPRPQAPRGGPAAAPAVPAIESILEALEWAAKPDEVVDQLVEGFGGLALQVAVFAEQGAVHRGRAASPSLGGAVAARAVAQPSSSACVLDRATTAGSYLGPLAPWEQNAAIDRLLGGVVGEVYAVPVVVSGRSALVLLLASMQATALASRRADELAKVAGRALERIVRTRKGR